MNQIKIKKIRISNEKISNRIVLIADVHYYDKTDLIKLNKVLDKIKILNPNYICILGDICDQAKVFDEDLLILWLEKLAKVAKVIMVYGNHDLVLYNDKHEYYFNKSLFKKIKQINNLYLLDNEIKSENGIRFIGLNLGRDYYYKYGENKEKFIEHYNRVVVDLDSNNYNILLSHSPLSLTEEYVITKLNCYKNIDMVLCGHTHGGLTPSLLRPILKTRGLVSPHKDKLFIKNVYGNFKIRNINFVVTSGITKLSKVSKFSSFDKLFDSEIMLIDMILT